MSLIKATYIATRPDRDPEKLAENIAREQSLEILDELIPDVIRQSHLGQVLGIEALDEERWALQIAYPAHLASGQIGQLLQLLYGNVSFYPRIRLAEIELADDLIRALPGPRAGIAGIRELIGVFDRALLLTVLKPRGSSPAELADLAERFALGGGDIVKDDQNLVETDLNLFQARVAGCAEAIERAAQTTGRRCLYLPHVAGSGDHLARQLSIVAQQGLPGVVMCPWFMGLETAASAAGDDGLMWLAHPAGAGVYTEPTDMGIAAHLVFGTLTRLAGADLCIYPGSGGRISTHGGDENRIAESLTGPLADHKATLPCTGGGKTLAQAPEVAASLGPDCAIVVGGDLLRLGPLMEDGVRTTIESLKVV